MFFAYRLKAGGAGCQILPSKDYFKHKPEIDFDSIMEKDRLPNIGEIVDPETLEYVPRPKTDAELKQEKIEARKEELAKKDPATWTDDDKKDLLIMLVGHEPTIQAQVIKSL